MLAGDPVAAERALAPRLPGSGGARREREPLDHRRVSRRGRVPAGAVRRGRGADGGLREHDVPRRCHVADLLADGTREGGRPEEATSISRRRSPRTRSRELRRRTGRTCAVALWRRWPRCSWRRVETDAAAASAGRRSRSTTRRAAWPRRSGYAPGSIPSRRAISGSAARLRRRRHDERHPRPEARACELGERRALDDRRRDRIRRCLVADHLVVSGVELAQIVDEHGQSRPVGLLPVIAGWPMTLIWSRIERAGRVGHAGAGARSPSRGRSGSRRRPGRCRGRTRGSRATRCRAASSRLEPSSRARLIASWPGYTKTPGWP